MLNEITIHGYLGKDPEIKEVEGQNGPFSRVSFSVAVSRDYGDETDWFYCVMNGRRAEVIHKYFHKGDGIVVEGRLESEKYTDKNGKSQTKWSVVSNSISFPVGGKKSSISDVDEPQPVNTDNLPF